MKLNTLNETQAIWTHLSELVIKTEHITQKFGYYSFEYHLAKLREYKLEMMYYVLKRDWNGMSLCATALMRRRETIHTILGVMK